MSERSLGDLETRRTRFEASIKKAQGVYSTLGDEKSPLAYRFSSQKPGSPERLEITKKVLATKTVLTETTIPKLEQRLHVIDEEIGSFRNNEQLVENYVAHIKSLADTESHLAKIRHAVMDGVLPQEELDSTEMYYNNLKNELEDPALVRGKEMYQAQRSVVTQEDEKQKATKSTTPVAQTSVVSVKQVTPAPKSTPAIPTPRPTVGVDVAKSTKVEVEQEPLVLVVDKWNRKVAVNDELIGFSENEMVVLKHLGEHLNKFVSREQLEKDLRDVGNASYVYHMVSQIREKFKAVLGEREVIARETVKSATKYKLVAKSVEFAVLETSQGVRCLVDPEEQTVKIGAKKHIFTKEELAVFTLIAKSDSHTLRARDLSKKLREVDIHDANQWKLVESIQKKIEKDPQSPKILLKSGRTAGVEYHLKGLDIEMVEKRTAEVTLPILVEQPVEKKVAPELLERHLAALEFIVLNPEGDMNTVINIMGNTKQDKPFTRPQTLFATKRGLSGAFKRVENDEATSDEKQVVDKIEHFVRDSGHDARRKFKEVVNNFFAKDRKPVVQIIDEPLPVEIPVDEPTEEEVSLVVTMLKGRKDLIKKYELAPIPDEILKEFATPAFRRKVERRTEEQLIELRRKAYEKFAQLIKSDQLVEMIGNTLTPRAQMVVEYFIDLDQNDQLDALEELLLKPKNGDKYSGTRFGVVGTKQEDEDGVKARTSKITKTSPPPAVATSVPTPRVIEAPKSQVTPNKPVAPVVPLTVVPVSVENVVKKTDLEKRLPDYEARVGKLIERVCGTQLEHFNVPQMAKIFNLKTKFLSDHEDIKAFTGPGGKPFYGVEEAVRLLAVKEFGNNLPNGIYKELKARIQAQVQLVLSTKDSHTQ